MPIDLEKEVYVQSMPKISLRDFLEEAKPEIIRRETFLVSVEDVVFADNIRPFDGEFIGELGKNILEQGQLQECIGDIIIDENGNLKVRIIAGQHRSMAILQINNDGTPLPIRISVANCTLSPEKVIEIQMSENLHNKMTAAQDATIIVGYWKRYNEIKEESGEKKMSITDLARKVGRSVDTVKNAIKYVEGLNPIVQKMVDAKILSYGNAILLTELEQGEGYYDQQVILAERFVRSRWSTTQAKKYMQKLKMEKSFAGPLFGGEWETIEAVQRIIAIKTEADRNGKMASDWLVIMMKLGEILSKNNAKVDVSEGITNAISKYGMGLVEFREFMRPFMTEHDFNKLFAKIKPIEVE